MRGPLSRSQRQERRIARRLGGRTTPGSGNGVRKNDVRTDGLSLEMKTTANKQYTLKAADLRLGERNALLDGREFAFGIELEGRNYILITEDFFVALLEGSDG